MVFVFSLEDEISFQTVYNYFLRLSSYRNTAEVPMVLVGTQGESLHHQMLRTDDMYSLLTQLCISCTSSQWKGDKMCFVIPEKLIKAGSCKNKACLKRKHFFLSIHFDGKKEIIKNFEQFLMHLLSSVKGYI